MARLVCRTICGQRIRTTRTKSTSHRFRAIAQARKALETWFIASGYTDLGAYSGRQKAKDNETGPVGSNCSQISEKRRREARRQADFWYDYIFEGFLSDDQRQDKQEASKRSDTCHEQNPLVVA